MTFEELIPNALAKAEEITALLGLAAIAYDDPEYVQKLREALFDKGIVLVIAYMDSEDLSPASQLGDLHLRQDLSIAVYETRSKNETGKTAYAIALDLLQGFTSSPVPGQPPLYKRANPPISPGPRDDPEHCVYFINLTAVTKN